MMLQGYTSELDEIQSAQDTNITLVLAKYLKGSEKLKLRKCVKVTEESELPLPSREG